MTNENSKQQLFEMMGKVNTNFKPRMDEVFGWSQKEKDVKGNQQKIEQAKQEIQKYPPSHLWAQPGRNNTPEAIKQLIDTRINMAKQYMPTLAELMPDLFDLSQGFFNIPTIHAGKPLDGVLPIKWGLYLKGEDGNVNNDIAVQKLNQELDALGQNELQEENQYLDDSDQNTKTLNIGDEILNLINKIDDMRKTTSLGSKVDYYYRVSRQALKDFHDNEYTNIKNNFR